MYKCCIFDLDGTLVNSIYAIQKSVNDTLSYWNMREISVEESRLYVGDATFFSRASLTTFCQSPTTAVDSPCAPGRVAGTGAAGRS